MEHRLRQKFKRQGRIFEYYPKRKVLYIDEEPVDVRVDTVEFEERTLELLEDSFADSYGVYWAFDRDMEVVLEVDSPHIVDSPYTAVIGRIYKAY